MQSILVYDGTCGICTMLAHIAIEMDIYQKLIIIPYQDPKTLVLTSVTPAMGKKSAYIFHNGELLKGAKAIFIAMSLLPGIYGSIGHVLMFSPFVSLVEPIYRLVARYRSSISLFFRLNNCNVPQINLNN